MSNGTSQARALLDRLEKSGHLINVYSGSWKPVLDFRKQFTEENFSLLDKEHGDGYRNHLLVVCLSGLENEVIQELCNIYPPLTVGIKRRNPAKILIINLATQQIIYAGLGRKFSLFVHDVLTDDYITGEHFHLNTPYNIRFLALDHLQIIQNLLTSLSELGEALAANEEQSAQIEINQAMRGINKYFPKLDEFDLFPDDPY